MRKLLISAALATATIAAAVPATAMAQPHYGWQRSGPNRAQVNDLLRDLTNAERRINRAPGISRREANGLRREARQVRLRLNRALRSNGINQREFFSLRAQVSRLEQRVRMENRDRDNRRY
jgi:Spy/CpxP family protein refolding chaperone